MITLRVFRSLLALILSAVVLQGCSPQEPVDEVLRLGTHIWPGYEPLHLAKSLGHVDERVKFREYASASSVIRAIKNGSIDAATLTLDEALVVQQSGVDIVIVLINDFSFGGDAILLRPDNADTQALKGLHIGVEGGAVGGYTLSRALETEGLSLDDVTTVYLKPNEQPRPLFEGEVDAVVTHEPYRSRLLKEGAVEYFSSRQIPREIVDVTVVSRTFYESQPKLVDNLVDGWYEALDFLISQPHLAHERIGERIKMSGEEVRNSLELLELPQRKEVEEMSRPGGELRVHAGRLMTFMRTQRMLSASVDLDAMFP